MTQFIKWVYHVVVIFGWLGCMSRQSTLLRLWALKWHFVIAVAPLIRPLVFALGTSVSCRIWCRPLMFALRTFLIVAALTAKRPKVVSFWNDWVTSFLKWICFFLNSPQMPCFRWQVLTKVFLVILVVLVVLFLLLIVVFFAVNFFIVILLLLLFTIVNILCSLIVFNICWMVGVGTQAVSDLNVSTGWYVRALVTGQTIHFLWIKQEVIVLALRVLLDTWLYRLALIAYRIVKCLNSLHYLSVFRIRGKRWSVLELLWVWSWVSHYHPRTVRAFSMTWYPWV